MSGLDRIHKFLNSNIVKDTYTIKFVGKPFSLNDIYSSGNQRGAFFKRKKIKDDYSKIFRTLMEESKLVKFEKFYLCIFYNSRHDVDNIIGMGKVFADTLREKYVPNDNKKHYRSVMVFVDDELDQNEFDFTIIDITNG